MAATEGDENNDREHFSPLWWPKAFQSVQSKDIKLNLGHAHETATLRWFPNPLIFFRRRTLRCVLIRSQWILIFKY